MLPDLRFFAGAALVAALVGTAGLGLLAVAQSQSKMGPLEAARNRAFADHAEWNQFYDADSVRRFVGLGPKAEIAQPADAAPENRGENVNSAPVAPAVLPPEISDGGERQDAAPLPAASPARSCQAPSRRCRRRSRRARPRYPHPNNRAKPLKPWPAPRQSLRCRIELTTTAPIPQSRTNLRRIRSRGTPRPRLQPPRPLRRARSPCRRIRRTAYLVRSIQLHRLQRPRMSRLPRPCRRCVSARRSGVLIPNPSHRKRCNSRRPISRSTVRTAGVECRALRSPDSVIPDAAKRRSGIHGAN